MLRHLGHALMENRHGLVVNVELTEANGHAERQAALAMAQRTIDSAVSTLGAEKGYDTQDEGKGQQAAHCTQHRWRTVQRRGRPDRAWLEGAT